MDKIIKSLLRPILGPTWKKYKHLRNRRFFRQFISKDSLCFDVGAHTGDITAIFCDLGARVIAIEPQPEFSNELHKRFPDSQVTIVQAGLASMVGEMEFSICSEMPTISTFSEDWKIGRFNEYNWDRKISVTVTTLDELIRKYGLPAFCKIDVEGFEREVLLGLSTPIPALSFEFTKENILTTVTDCIYHLKDLGYKRFNFVYDEEYAFRFHGWVDSQMVINEIDHNPNSLTWGDIYASL